MLERYEAQERGNVWDIKDRMTDSWTLKPTTFTEACCRRMAEAMNHDWQQRETRREREQEGYR